LDSIADFNQILIFSGVQLKIEKVTLSGSRVRLEPLSNFHMDKLASVITDGNLNESPITFVPHPENLQKFIDVAESGFHSKEVLAFATVDIASGQLAGSTRFRDINLHHMRAQIGATFIAQSWQRTYINTEAKYLMLRFAFEYWRLNRIELFTDVLNSKSRNAIVRIGGKEEGIMRNHMVMRDGRVRDSILYSIINSEWPELRLYLESKLDSAEFSYQIHTDFDN
jgi:N-acetyltransferase